MSCVREAGVAELWEAGLGPDFAASLSLPARGDRHLSPRVDSWWRVAGVRGGTEVSVPGRSRFARGRGECASKSAVTARSRSAWALLRLRLRSRGGDWFGSANGVPAFARATVRVSGRRCAGEASRVRAVATARSRSAWALLRLRLRRRLKPASLAALKAFPSALPKAQRGWFGGAKGGSGNGTEVSDPALRKGDRGVRPHFGNCFARGSEGKVRKQSAHPAACCAGNWQAPANSRIRPAGCSVRWRRG